MLESADVILHFITKMETSGWPGRNRHTFCCGAVRRNMDVSKNDVHPFDIALGAMMQDKSLF